MSSVHVAWQSMMQRSFSDSPTKEDIEKHFGTALLAKWKTEFEKRCWGSDQFAEVSFHVLFGQLPSIRAIPIHYENNTSDMRVHCMLFQRSGTGKGRGFSFVVEMAQQLELVCMKPDATTDAVLLGSFERIEGEPEPNQIFGILDPNKRPQVNLLMMNEAILILDTKKTDWNKDYMTYYQIVMNPIGTPDNRIEKTNLSMGGQIITINPVVSLFLTTYPPDKLLETITKAGFIQRMITLYNIQTFEERKDHWKTMTAKTGKMGDKSPLIAEIVNALKYINQYYRKNPFIIMSDETSANLQMVMRQIFEPLDKVNDAMREHLADFVPRIYDNLIKLAYHHAMCRLSPIVENKDVLYGLKIMRPAWLRMIEYMEESDEIVEPTLRKWKRWRIDAYSAYDTIITEQKAKDKYNEGWVKKETLVKLLSSKLQGWDKSKTTTRSRLDKMVKTLRFFEEKTIGGIKCIRKPTTER